jgi:hypothetical protein
VYSDGLALGVKVYTASSTAAINLSALCYVVPSGGVAPSVVDDVPRCVLEQKPVLLLRY